MKKLIVIVLVLTALSMRGHDERYKGNMMIPIYDHDVVATIYKPNVGTHTADGFKINKKRAAQHRLIAVSRDLKKKFPFGTKVLIVGAGKLDGIYTVKDLMHRRWTNKIDILVDQNHRLCKFNSVKLVKLRPTYKHSSYDRG